MFAYTSKNLYILGSVLIHGLVFAVFPQPGQTVLPVETPFSLQFRLPETPVVKAKPTLKSYIKKPIKHVVVQQKIVQPLVITPLKEISEVPVVKPEPMPVPVVKAKTVPIPVLTEARFRGQRRLPTYPRRSLRLGQEGTVVLRALVAEDGYTREVRLFKSSHYQLLDQSALESVRKWRFVPSYINERPILSWIEVPVQFKLR